MLEPGKKEAEKEKIFIFKIFQHFSRIELFVLVCMRYAFEQTFPLFSSLPVSKAELSSEP